MKINQIIVNETSAGATSSGSIATVSSPIGATQTRNPSIYGGKKAGNLFTGKKTNKPYANSLSEGKMKDLKMDLSSGRDGLSDIEFKKKYGKSKEEMRKALHNKPKSNKPVQEAKLDEDDIIVVPGRGSKRKTGFVPHGQSRVDHEVEMARSDLLATIKNAKSLYDLLKDRNEEEGLEGWVQEKLIKANDYLNAVKEYYDEKMMPEMSGGVIAGGGVGEGRFTVNAKTGAKLHPRTGVELPPKEKPLTMKQMFAAPKKPAAPKLTLDDVWRQVEHVVGQIYPDGDPIDWLAPWFRKQGIADHKIGDILERAAKKNGYKDIYDYYNSFGDDLGLAEDYTDSIGNPMYDAVCSRFMRHPEGLKLLQQFGPETVMSAVDDVTDGWEGEEIGSSDISAYFKRAAELLQGGRSEPWTSPNSPDNYVPDYEPQKGWTNPKEGIGDTIKRGLAQEGAKVDRMVKHIAKSERELGKSKEEAENIAWATANKRGMLDNKNKKK